MLWALIHLHLLTAQLLFLDQDQAQANHHEPQGSLNDGCLPRIHVHLVGMRHHLFGLQEVLAPVSLSRSLFTSNRAVPSTIFGLVSWHAKKLALRKGNRVLASCKSHEVTALSSSSPMQTVMLNFLQNSDKKEMSGKFGLPYIVRHV